MTVKPFQTLEAFLASNPQRNHSSRVFSRFIPTDGGIVTSIAVSVADAFLRDVGISILLSATVADATLRDVADGPAIGVGVTSLAFTATEIGSTSDRTVVITNNGSSDLVITSLTPSGDFSIISVTA